MQRRRGEALESALLQAAWDELMEHGYAAFTIDAVAQRAGTSKPVVYRRWGDKAELIVAAIQHISARQPAVADPDTGTLRGDILELARQMNESRVAVIATAGVLLGEFYRETGTTLADLRDLILQGRESMRERIFDRAVARGEADPAKLTPLIMDLPFDLFRHRALMTLKPVPVELMEEIVDTVLLPLIRPEE